MAVSGLLRARVGILLLPRRGIRVMSTTMDALKPLIAVCQMTSTSDKEKNFTICSGLIQEAASRKASMVFLPEAFDYIGGSTEETLSLAETLKGDTIQRYMSLARRCSVWLSLGGFHEKGPNWETDRRIFNSHVVLDNTGHIVSIYRKTHLFDVDLHSGVSLKESKFTIPGPDLIPPINTPAGKVGLGVCYDLRFPEMALALIQEGAELLTYPSAFTVTTGIAHWEVLLRARAIENQCYVVAAAQTGSHNQKRSSYGHAMVVDPWGSVIAQCQDGIGLCYAEINLPFLSRVRRDMPVQSHRRNDLYGKVAMNTND
ncbi:deaminated glutathione amidase isoform X2 [Pelobates cultripes]|uniref:Deaminated glutathione amidase n=2 Tax=Pelobates cultripes TaxID=61616 RepID=A0AAD1TKY2_PELCU|nr:deaminated glutathione amidase isoform X2 [Pelobates cultripes]